MVLKQALFWNRFVKTDDGSEMFNLAGEFYSSAAEPAPRELRQDAHGEDLCEILCSEESYDGRTSNLGGHKRTAEVL